MMKKIKAWIYNKFLPMWAKETLLKDNVKLTARNAELEAKIKELEAYTDGLEYGLRCNRKIIIKGETKN